MPVARQIARGFVLRCPNCGRGRIYRGLFTIRKACTECGRPFLKDSGDWTGGAEITILGGSAAAFVVFFALSAFTDWPFRVIAAIVLGVAAITIPLAYRHVKGAWVGAVRAWEGPQPTTVAETEPEWFREFWKRERER